MALILSLETSTSVCSVAIHSDGKVLATSEIHVGQSAAAKLAVLIDNVKKAAGIELKTLSAIGISSGPGSYTGLRIGTSTAKGLCYALNIPLISATALDVMAHTVSKFNTDNALLCPMIDARRMEVYCQVVENDLKKIHQPIEAKIIDASSFREFLDSRKVVFFGDGAHKCSALITHDNASFIEDIFPSASDLGSLVYQKFVQRHYEVLTHFEPFYLKDFLIKTPTVKF
jgi:tRNA threonylcarbamoyladenosine biosynthesis protein TsaB